MTPRRNNGRAARTVLEQNIWDRGETLAEFAEYAERFARQVGERGTLSERHLKRLVAGRKPDGSPVGNTRAATARLLERIFGIDVDDLLSPPAHLSHDMIRDGETELRGKLSASSRVDNSIVTLLHGQLDAIRRLDRQLGAIVARDEVGIKIAQVTRLLTYSLSPGIREGLATIRAELGTLAGWQALDLGNLSESWQQYEDAKAAASESGRHEFNVHTAAEQAFVLVDLGETRAAVELLSTTCRHARGSTSRLLQAWLAAAHGEALAADDQRSASLRAFDQALKLLPNESSADDGPYVVLDDIHLARWRGHALARIGDSEGLEVLLLALNGLDKAFARAETSLRVDLATTLATQKDYEHAQTHLANAHYLAGAIGSIRQQRRIDRLAKRIQPNTK